MKSIHILLIVDSCFSGDIRNISRVISEATDAIEAIDNVYFSKAFSKVSRQVLTSGASERVPDVSQFARALKLSLKDTGHQEGASFLLFKRQDDSKDKETAVKTGDEKKTIP